jgi:hypothetical protein
MATTLTPTQKKKWRAACADYCRRAEDNRLNRGYSQRRPGIGYGLAPEAIQIDDCSIYTSKATYWASHHTGIFIPDPLDEHYTGWGYTGTMESNRNLTEVPFDHKFFVGDYAIWGPNETKTTHTAICRAAGTFKSAIFSSHGHQSWRFVADAPEPIKLPYFPEHLIGVYRQKLLG